MDEAARSPAARASEALEEGREAARASIDEVRRIVRDLRPEALDDLGLPSAMMAMAAAFERQTGIPLERHIPAHMRELSREQELVVYRVTQEALTNVARHAKASTAELLVDHADGFVEVTVRDDGCGFDGPPPEDGGLRGMRERALLVSGTVNVDSTPGRGTEIVLSVPVADAP
jgi:two-component system sensor histidine kinase UhpB